MTEIILLQTKHGSWDILGTRMPLSLLSIAAIPYQRGYEIVLIDQRTDFDWQSRVRKHLSLGAKIVCLTLIAGGQIKFVIEASRFVKSLNPNVLVLLGGTWAQTEPELCLQEETVDVACYGEGDYLLPEIMAYCEGKKKIEDIPGIVYRTREGSLNRNAPRPLVKNLDNLPRMPYCLINPKDYTAIRFRPNRPSAALVLSRGCRCRCTFCSIPSLYGRTWRHYSVNRVMDELLYLETKHGIKDFFFMDDNIAGDYRWFSEVISTLAESGKDYYWSTTGTRADTILRLSDKDLDNLLKSGCKQLDIGVESGSERILKLLKKDFTLETVREASRKLRDCPVVVKYSFAVGFPTETEEELLGTLGFRDALLKENKHAIAPIFNYTPYPGTSLYALALSQGLRPPDTFQGWADFNYDTWYKRYPSWLTKKRIRLIENAVFLSYFAEKNLTYKYPNPLMNALFKAYYPFAKFRSSRKFQGFMVEKWIGAAFKTLNDKIDLFNRMK